MMGSLGMRVLGTGCLVVMGGLEMVEGLVLGWG